LFLEEIHPLPIKESLYVVKKVTVLIDMCVISDEAGKGIREDSAAA